MHKEQNKRISVIGVGGCGYNIAMDVKSALSDHDISFSWIDKEKHEGNFPECDNLTEQIKNSEVVIFTAGLGRYTSDVIFQTVVSAHEANPSARIIVVCTTPFHFESERLKKRAAINVDELKDVCEVVDVDNCVIEQKMANISFTRMNEPIVEMIQEIVDNV